MKRRCKYTLASCRKRGRLQYPYNIKLYSKIKRILGDDWPNSNSRKIYWFIKRLINL
jgi:hypothetical protein